MATDAASAASASTGRRASTRLHTASDQPDTWTGASGLAVAPGQRRGRRPVEGPAGQEGSQRRRALVGHRARRHVAHVPAGLAQAPHQVHVLATAERRIEEVGPQRHVGADKEGRARNEWDAAPRAARVPPGRRGRVTNAPIRSGRTRRTTAYDPRRHRRHQWVVEVAEQRLEPSIGRPAVGVDEGHEPGVNPGQPGVRRASRADVGGQARRSGRRAALRSLWSRPRLPTASSTTTQAIPPERVEQPVELGRTVAHRHDDRHVVRAEGRAPRLRTKAPADTNGRAGVGLAGGGPTGLSDRQRSTSCRASSEMRKRRSGLPRSRTVPPSKFSRRRVLDHGEGGRAAVSRAGMRRPQCGGHPGCAGLGRFHF